MGVWKCRKCHAFLTGAELESHECDGEIPLMSMKDIPIEHYTICDSKKEETIILAWGWDGIVYRLNLSPKLGYQQIIASDDSLQGNQSNEDLSKPLNEIFIFI